ncbi:MAG: hypothetical protein ACTSPZ_09845 [Promethearchaeota archaeon]
MARPVVEVRDFRTNRLSYEIYSFGQDIVINPINPLESKGSFRHEARLNEGFPSRKKRNKKIELDIKVSKQKILIKADPAYASNNIIVFADNQEIFTGSLSRTGVIALSLSNKEGRKLLKEYDRDKHIYGIIK